MKGKDLFAEQKGGGSEGRVAVLQFEWAEKFASQRMS